MTDRDKLIRLQAALEIIVLMYPDTEAATIAKKALDMPETKHAMREPKPPLRAIRIRQ